MNYTWFELQCLASFFVNIADGTKTTVLKATKFIAKHTCIRFRKAEIALFDQSRHYGIIFRKEGSKYVTDKGKLRPLNEYW